MTRLINYLITGLIASGVDFGLFALLLRVGHWQWFPAGCVSFTISVLAGYLISIRIVFQSGARFKKTDEILLVFLTSIIGLMINQGLLYLLINGGFAPLIAKLVASVAVISWNFIGRSQFIFREQGVRAGKAE